ncbi:hypothetical protein [Methylobacterium sp. NEAU K]|uniref:hypothetical protein n=1 Tax=Methylobacterium sp. NEAU K TaxID=3064946 RepID=UPI0027341BC9|nr:hypothetical protein [Methylobacterium sp. NEAU K]MDP4005999.1 hypothetical protein [Methylobacterium sp. NEAU K]
MVDKRVLGLVRLAAWILVAALITITLVPIGLRPVVTANPSFERAAAYAAAGLLMIASYPRHWPWVLAGSVLLAGGLEASQTLTGTRHGRFDDFLVKAGAALIGEVAGLAILSWAGHRLRMRAGG